MKSFIVIKLIFGLKAISKEFGGLTDKVATYIELVKEKACLEVGLLFKPNIFDHYANPAYPCKFIWNTNQNISTNKFDNSN